jgi:hypothetical protein
VVAIGSRARPERADASEQASEAPVNEGVIKFALDHEASPLGPTERVAVEELAAWRQILRRLKLLGQDPSRYEGAGFGNVSLRLGEGFLPPGRRSFLITGTQTAGQAAVGLEDFALVEVCDYRRNAVRSRGSVRPSSEAMTHGAIYDLDARIRAVFHVHSPDIWRRSAALGLPTTDPLFDCRWPMRCHLTGISEVAEIFCRASWTLFSPKSC